MKVKYVAIEREYGSGGTQIAKMAASKLNIKAYGKEIIDEVSSRVNIPVSDLENYERNVSGSFLYSLFLMNQSQMGNPDVMSNEAKLFVAQSKVIRDFAHNGPAIFVGHCASHILKDHSGLVRVFIRSSDNFKKQRIVEQYGIDEKDVNFVCKSFDKKRANYYAFCTQKKWNDYDNYDLIIDSQALGIDKSADLIASLFE